MLNHTLYQYNSFAKNIMIFFLKRNIMIYKSKSLNINFLLIHFKGEFLKNMSIYATNSLLKALQKKKNLPRSIRLPYRLDHLLPLSIS